LGKQEDIYAILNLTSDVKSGVTSISDAAKKIRAAEWFKSSWAEVRERAIRSSQSMAIVDIERELRPCLADADAIVRLMAISYYGIFKPLMDQHIQTLLPLLTDADPDIATRTRRLFADKLSAEAAKAWGISWCAHPISAWEAGCMLLSPNRHHRADYSGIEIAMGAPTIGSISVGQDTILRGNASIIWSNDSRYLAFPKWHLDRSQTLGILDTDSHKEGVWSCSAAVYQTISFENGLLKVQVDPLTSSAMESHSIADVIW
jgi:hypothetical protein